MKRLLSSLLVALSLMTAPAFGQEPSPSPLVPGVVYECTSPSGFTFTMGVGEGGGDSGVATCVAIGEDPGPIWIDDQLVIEEDDPRWDCSTMGNMICGEEDNIPVRDPGKDLTGMFIVQKVR